MVLRNLQSRFARCLVGIPFQDLKSLVHAALSVEEAIALGLWTNTAPSPNNKGKKPVRLSSRSGEVDTISYQHQRLAYHSLYRPPTIRAHFSHPQHRISQFMFSSLTLLGLACNHGHHIRATPLLPRPYAPRLTIQFTPLSMTLTRAFEKLRDAGVIVSLAPRPLPYPILPHFCLHEYCLYHHIQGHDAECCVALHHVIKDLIDSRLVNLFGPSVTTNPLPTHSTHAVPPPPGLQ